ncbi:exodeoxyribonuclease V subunit alpha [Gordonia sp. ABSL1-1]|uniref:exodeoxyribonuclease V subunit alpha n=1 Tax=Gordonia sp. ABSL1-1 TaxID=3053923 RepID=UPI0025727DA3|nr:exodeoxyribonuclease V subunit alpha [Gordonia sp. ABSL1-1]MDL9937277.1 exodeoxyribonuclease V subunit alpha [Gordonia sp. ABSL1-1]
MSAVLSDWADAGVLGVADVHITERLVRMCGEPVGEDAQLGAALAVRSVRLGSTCFALDRAVDVLGADDDHGLAVPGTADLVAALVESPLVAGARTGPLRPLVLMSSADGPLLYLQKYFRQEQLIREVLEQRSQTMPTVDDAALTTAIAAAFDAPEGMTESAIDMQRVAAAVAAIRTTTVLAGGPGTGKTYTVARILAVLRRLHGPDLRIGLCAPTGRAAAQLQASVSDEASRATASGKSGLTGELRAVTVHSLLGWRPGSNPRYGRGRTLPHDVIVVDETSMLSMTAMSRLLEAVRPDARLIFVGDPHQLASVDAGAVLADLVERTAFADAATSEAATSVAAHSGAAASIAASAEDRVARIRRVVGADVAESESARLAQGVVTLRRGYRFGGGIAAVAAAVNAGDADTVLDLIADPAIADVELVDPADISSVRGDVVRWGRELRHAADAGDADTALAALDSHRVLCAHREGAWGVRGWSRRVAEWLGHPDRDARDVVEWYRGQPILVTANDRQTSTFNGDTGVVIADPAHERTDAVRIAFRRGAQLKLLAPTQLADVAPVYAMTIHRSQGSQFERVTVVLPPTGSELLTRELLYTAITRARHQVRIVATPEVLGAAVARRVQRASGLRSPVTVIGPGPSAVPGDTVRGADIQDFGG